MTFAFVRDVPATEEMYREIREKVGPERPAGLIVHAAARIDGGLRYIDLWESEEAWQAFHDSRLDPAVAETLAAHGIPRPDPLPENQPLDVIDLWLGAPVPA